MHGVARELELNGYAVVPGVVSAGVIAELAGALDAPASDAGRRNLLDDVPAVRGLLDKPGLVALVRGLFAGEPRVVKATLFDKRPGADWAVRWHQDTALAFAERVEAGGFGPWSEKAGVAHAAAPAGLLARVLAVRVQVDDGGEAAGPLRVVPGSHGLGRLTPERAAAARAERGEAVAACPAGGVVLMRPLCLHASGKMAGGPGVRRRVVHLEVTDAEPPAPMRWRWADRFGVSEERAGT